MMRGKGLVAQAVTALLLISIIMASGNSRQWNKHRQLQALSRLASSSWPKYRADAQNSGRGNGIRARGETKWIVQTQQGLTSTGVIGTNGSLYFGATDGVITISSISGRSRIAYHPGRRQDVPEWAVQNHWREDFTTPTVSAEGVIYVGSSYGRVYALDTVTGQTKWYFKAGEYASFITPAAIGDDGTIYVGSNDNEVYALSSLTGKKIWGFRTGDFVETSPALGYNGLIYVGSRDKRVYALERRSGVLRWSFTASGVIESALAVSPNGTVYVCSKDGTVYSLNGNTGKLQWMYNTRHDNSPPAIGKTGVIYIGADKVYALDGKTGALQWKFGQSYGFGEPVISGGRSVYVIGRDAKLYAIDENTGKKQWALPISGGIGSVTVGADSTIYVGTYSGKVYAIH